jgi:hypothetical protein
MGTTDDGWHVRPEAAIDIRDARVDTAQVRIFSSANF